MSINNIALRIQGLRVRLYHTVCLTPVVGCIRFEQIHVRLRFGVMVFHGTFNQAVRFSLIVFTIVLASADR